MSDDKRLGLRDLLIILALALALLAPGIASIPPMDRDESRYAVSSTQMLTSGDIVDIRFQERPRYLQPAGIYWLQAGAVALVSSPEAREIWAYRLPSLLGAALAVLLTAGAGASLFGRRAGVAAGVLLAACFSLNFEARTAKIDGALLAGIVAAQWALLEIYLDRERSRQGNGRTWAAVFWAALGVGMMLKGPIILLIAGPTIAALCLWDRRVAWLKRLHAGWGVLILLAIVLPWYIAIGVVSDGAFYANAVGVSLLGKVAKSQQSHAGPPGYHLALFPLVFWPSVLFAGIAALFAWRRRAEPGVRFLIAWIVPTWLIFELVATKLPHYVLPTYPAIACLAAAALFTPDETKSGWRTRALAMVGAVLFVFASALIAALAPVAIWRLGGRIDPFAIAAGVFAFAFAVAALVFFVRRRPVGAVASAALAGLAAWPNIFAIAPPQLASIWLSPRIAAAASAHAPCPETILVTHPFIEPSLVFLYGPSRTRLTESPAEAAAAFAAAPSCALAAIGAAERDAFIAGLAARGLHVQPVATIEGTNYSNGDALTLTLYRAAP